MGAATTPPLSVFQCKSNPACSSLGVVKFNLNAAVIGEDEIRLGVVGRNSEGLVVAIAVACR
ncbi:hypothetical protein BVRB_7g180570 [Beta vulgaris subsp. vulgaris]|uniref:Uncharacterized protein n=1 Tax=Beta vulgaris subsp. vulgaris TaxID=3555 RepID=A0A0J8B7C1_BETVV|nr:hypothetical protein BVRB_7g180570 [Beta vulgaris subsp. vulgaris]